MEPNKMENQFREQLNEREIQPSDIAWDRLDAMLSIAEKKKRKIPWIYIAASVLGFLLIGTAYFNGFENLIVDKNTPAVVEEKGSVNNFIDSEAANAGGAASLIQNNIIKKSKVVAANNNLKKNLRKFHNVMNEELTSNQLKNSNTIASSSENKNYQSISKNKYVSGEKLLAEVSNTQFEPKVTDITIEKTRKGISIDPNSLLSNAETELNQSFRESALDRLSKNFNAVKTVLVNRNYEE
ncbi:hypothetical protein [Flavobacterium granuli]|uniref:Uncharacterized protein n=1 Tax=Flavobacterium granuli TaxID=280093 RepID=A0A1M5MYM4_9FLAO|nr:hypothetical protein [Flavobacterium granuli]PRZ25130.1 hypothetical protein BC624_103213 [Flavobacterium granuli]SHG82408.1 hypothetical protein SAMN05443373_104213 [Flavobacterium granuli]